ncbi:hypothetical protein DFR50_14230 [Roseiarcus fermentans]|uniref:dATP/dGTP diphosphohydrolase N-terminal domain-containing protein n=1 Tax=Roseiarcus fermentans TaxID=1473586 RepID=A0A366EMW9_9HYPH|nr:dATP/dGTP diphosphohydrolase domain-containing protein [Roseiarcus fermentans]RBP03782.1 hypothetical protein DFR50_14230 [Roseiarcus fermentans]
MVALDNLGRKDDSGKDPWHLLPFDAVRAIVKVLAHGAKKYEPRNWERGMDWERPYAACLRHLTAWWDREEGDPETGFSHLWHAGCCIVFLIAFELRGIGRDTRPAAAPKRACVCGRDPCAYDPDAGCGSPPPTPAG